MHRLATPWCFLGPSGSGKASQARRWIEEAYGVKLTYPLEQRTFSVGDGYEARVLTSPYHFEIDIPNLSMQDKQIIGELLTMFLSSGDVLNSLHSSSRKLVLLRRAHCLSLPAAIRVRAILQQYVFPAGASGMIWMTSREMTGALSLLQDGFVRVSVPRISMIDWCAKEEIPVSYRTPIGWEKLEGHPERAIAMAQFFPDGTTVWPRRIQDFYDEMVEEMIKMCQYESSLDMVLWIRGRVYDALSFCQTGPEIVDSCAAALLRFYEMHPETPADMLWEAMEVLAKSEPHTSYRTPLALEWAILNLWDVMHRIYQKSGTDVNGTAGNTSCMAGLSATQTSGDTSLAKVASPKIRRTKAGGKS